MSRARAPRARRSLANQGGPVQTRGAEADAATLASALDLSGGPSDALTHGFHTYPARMHPAIARAVIAAYSEPGQRVLDPFCGSGTGLVEAMVAGREAVGVDLSPLALRIAEVHTALRDGPACERFTRALERVTEASLVRVRARERVRAQLSARDRALYEPHVLLELAGLLQEIRALEHESDRRALEIVFSSLCVKFSNKRADTSDELIEKRIRKGLCSEFFLRKGRELCERWQALASAVPPGTKPPALVLGDARSLPELLADARRFDLVLSSPPYGGTYDYYAQHALRCSWLDLPARELERFEQGELGARRRLSRSPTGAGAFDRELAACLRAIAAVCKPSARIVLLLGDAELSGMRVDARAQLAKLAKPAGLTLLASASQPRADHRGGAPRGEHLVLLARTG